VRIGIWSGEPVDELSVSIDVNELRAIGRGPQALVRGIDAKTSNRREMVAIIGD
jgi:hypothetical protein